MSGEGAKDYDPFTPAMHPATPLLTAALGAALALGGCLGAPTPWLEDTQLPAGLHNCMPGTMLRELGVETNPGALPASLFAEFASEIHDPPDKAWVQVLTREAMIDCDDARHSVFVYMLRWSDPAALDALVAEIEADPDADCGDERALWGRGDYIFMHSASGTAADDEDAMQTDLESTYAAFQQKHGDMTAGC